MNISSHLTPAFRQASSGLFPPLAAPAAPSPAGTAPAIDSLASADLFSPGMPMPECVQQAMAACLGDAAMAHYTHPLGLPVLRQAIADRLWAKYQYRVDPQRHILVTPGSEPALQLAFAPFLQPGDEVLMPDPGYLANRIDVAALGGVPVHVPQKEEQGYALDLPAWQKSVTPRTKAAVLTLPNNPTGAVYTPQELRSFCRFIVENDLVLICDCAFDDYLFDGCTLLWPAAEPDMWERTVSVFTLSKGYGLCGLRVGYMVAGTAFLDALLGVFPAFMGSVSAVAQVGAAAALRDEGLLSRYRQRLDIRRRRTYAALCQVPGLGVTMPRSGFSFWLNTEALGSAPDIVRRLREEARVQVNNGAAFGPKNGPGHIRLVFGCLNEDAVYEAAIARLCAALRDHHT